MHASILNSGPAWGKLVLLALVISAIVAVVRNPHLRPWFFGGAFVLAVVAMLGYVALPSPGPGSYIHTDVNGTVTEIHATSVRGFSLVMIVVPLILMGAGFLAARGHRGRGGWMAIPAIVGLLAVFGIWGSRHQRYSVYPLRSNLPADATAEVPLEELIDQYNRPRIQLSQTVAEKAVEADEHAAEATTETVAEASTSTPPPVAEHEHESDHELLRAHALEDAAITETGEIPVSESEPEFDAPSEPPPSWVGAQPRTIENIHRVPVKAGLYLSKEESYQHLREQLKRAVAQRMEDIVGESTGQRYVHIPDLEWMRIGTTYIDRELLNEEVYFETTKTTMGPMVTAWGLLEFTPEQDQRLLDAWKGYARQRGIGMVATLALLVVAVLGGVFALLKIDTWTRGYYSKRLFIGVPAAIIGVFVFLLLANQ